MGSFANRIASSTGRLGLFIGFVLLCSAIGCGERVRAHASVPGICLADRENSIAEVFRAMRKDQTANRKGAQLYSGYIAAFQQSNVGMNEQLARLIAAETRAASCDPKLDVQLVRVIAEVLKERIRRRIRLHSSELDRAAMSVLYQPSQFASSLHFYSMRACSRGAPAPEAVDSFAARSHPEDFLCPLGDPKQPDWSRRRNLFSEAMVAIEEAMAELKESAREHSDRAWHETTTTADSEAATHYFLKLHSVCWPTPPASWKQPMKDISNKLLRSEELRQCIAVWNEPGWR